MRLVLVGCVLLAGCNALLGNGDFRGPDTASDCAARGLPPATLSGTVFAPNGSLPIYNALVYVPTAALADIPDGASGPTCASGSPAVSAFSDAHGHFTLENVPAGGDLPLVIQVGKWRRAVTVPSVPACGPTAVDASLTHLPRDSTEGHIPRIAIATGASDTLECVAHDAGIADSEIGGGAASTARVRLYNGTGAMGSAAGPFEPLSALVDPATIQQYDAVMLGCPGIAAQSRATPAGAAALLDFTNRGGWLWVTHLNYPWLQMAPAPWATLGTFDPTVAVLPAGTNALIDQGTPQGQDFATWSAAAGVPGPPGEVTLAFARANCRASEPTTTRRVLYLDLAQTTPGLQMFTWDSAMAGRLVFSDVHLGGSTAVTTQMLYPAECTALPATQDKVVLFELFDTPTCLP